MSINTKYRTQATEIMDDFSLQGEELREALRRTQRSTGSNCPHQPIIGRE
jgi:hypothetical protein